MSHFKYSVVLSTVICLLLAGAIGVTSGPSSAAAPRDGERREVSAGAVQDYMPGEVLVKFRPGVGSEGRYGAMSTAGARTILASIGPEDAKDIYLLGLTPGVTVDQAVEALRGRDDVVYAEPNYIYSQNYTPTDPGFPSQWGLHNTGQTIQGAPGTPDADIDAPEAWDVEKGNTGNVTVAVIDSGIDFTHADLDANIWVNSDETAGNGVDDDGNGYVDDRYGYNWAGISQYKTYGYWYFGQSATTQSLAQSFTARAPSGGVQKLSHVGILLHKVGSPTSNITVAVRSSLGGSNLASFTVSPGEVSTSTANEFYKPLSSTLTLTSNATYYLVFSTSGVDSSNYYGIYDNWGASTFQTYTEGQEYQWDGSSWVPFADDDFYFRTNPYHHPRDNNGHGTHCAGIVAAEDDGAGAVGVACGGKTKVMPLKAGDSSGSLFSDHIISAIYYAADNGAKVISMSFGGTGSSTATQDAVNYAAGKGVVLFASSGNSSNSTMQYPAGYTNVLGVGATTNTDVKASFSTFNSSVDISAPGKDIYSTMPTYAVALNGLGYTQNYSFLSGTSMACPMVAGLAALVLSRNSTLTRTQVEQVITGHADDLGTPGRDDSFGYGRINASGTITNVPVQPSKPSISSLNPQAGNVGREVSIYGKYFGSTRGSSYVKFGGVKASTYTYWSSTTIKVKVPAGPYNYVPVTVTTSAGTSNNNKTFKVIPKITSISPTSGKVNSYVTINGSGFGASRGANYVRMGGKNTAIVSWADTKIKIKVPTLKSGLRYALYVFTRGGASNQMSFKVI